MQKTTSGYRLSATDLSKYLSCTYATRMDKEVEDGVRSKPDFTDPNYYTIKELGLEHERRYVQHLKELGLNVAELKEGVEGESHVELTINAMHQGYDIIVQAGLEGTLWRGKADILKKVNTPSALGNWSYEVMDTKLGQETQGGAVLQLCVYSDLVAAIQGRTPQHIHVVKPGDPFDEEAFRLDDFNAYFRWIRGKLESSLPRIESMTLYPDPVPYCDTCRWWSVCDKRRRADDHLSFVAGLHNTHARELQSQNLPTLETFALAAQITPPSKGSIDTFHRLQKQAKIQQKQRQSKTPEYEYLKVVDGEGLTRLPEPDAGDVFFDIEGDRFYPGGGIEYLLGICYLEQGQMSYRAYWALNRTDEKRQFDALMDFLMNRWTMYPDMHIYHFAPYEPSAVKHLMLRFSIWGEELDKLLRAERFVDLHLILKQSIRAGVEKYGLKEMEPFYAYQREMALKTASHALRNVQRALELDVVSKIGQPDLDIIAEYNKEDCISTARLRDWLEDRRRELIDHGELIERPLVKDDEPPEDTVERIKRIKEVYGQLIVMIPEEAKDRNAQDKHIALLADLLEYFRREEKNAWWEFFRINDLEPNELFDERKAITGLEFIQEFKAPGSKKLPTHQYRYPAQEFSGKPGDKLKQISPDKEDRIDYGKITEHDHVSRLINIKKTNKSVGVHAESLQINDFIGGKVIENALLKFAENVIEDGIEGTGKFAAARDLLFRLPPRFKDGSRHISYVQGEEVVKTAIRLSQDLHSTVLAIQGPPGTGKTYTGAQMIIALQKAGKRIGVTAISHKAIDNLLKWVHKLASEQNHVVPLAHKDDEDNHSDSIIEYIPGNKVDERLDSCYVVGGTSFLWASDAMEEKLDYLFIDEAGQMSLAYALAVCRSAQNIIMLGDPQQLDQPQKAAHPDGADVSALQHYIGDHQVIESDRGLFLNMTWRLHPGICAFTSKQYYEGKLTSRAELDKQHILNNAHFDAQPLVYIPVDHSGNSNNSPEEVEAIALVVDQLMAQGTRWIKVGPTENTERDLTKEDIMIIAPYNAQVSALQRELPDYKGGTVDKFQGQEAAVVIYSMTSSSAEDAPRGMSFLYQPNRLNVASSRAKCLFILVASPKLFEAECKTPDQMKMANGLCAFREMV